MNLFQDKRPIYGQDPYITMLGETPLLCESVDEKKITVSTIESLKNPQRVKTWVVWDEPGEQQVWAPELHYIEGVWFIYYTASDGNNNTHRTYGLQGSSCLGKFTFMGRVGPDVWGIDMTQFEWRGIRYAVWSGWEDNGDEFPQNLYIAEMDSPWSVGDRVKLSVPEFDWELSIAPILEGPQVWIRDEGLSILYSGNASWKQEYSTGKLILVGSNPLNPDNWKKQSTPLMRNAGHGCIVKDYFIYHTKISAFPGWSDREIKSIRIEEL